MDITQPQLKVREDQPRRPRRHGEWERKIPRKRTLQRAAARIGVLKRKTRIEFGGILTNEVSRQGGIVEAFIILFSVSLPASRDGLLRIVYAFNHL